MIKAAVLIFIKNPELGKVKTRLAASVGNDAALAVYQKLLRHTLLVSKDLPVDRFIFYSDRIDPLDMWPGDKYFKHVQSEGDLGQRMLKAFEKVFGMGYNRVVIIGSDCIELDQEILLSAFHQLRTNDVVIGPARDGGYYLLGLNTLHPRLFYNKNWSSESVLNDTLSDLREDNIDFFKLVTLSDIDTIEDLAAHPSLLTEITNYER